MKRSLKNTVLYMIGFILACIVVSGVQSCRTRQERAQSKLAKAISLDPSILQSTQRVVDSVRIKDSIRITDSVTIIPKTVTQIDWKTPCDSTGKLKDFNYESGNGASYVHIWTDSLGLHYSSKVDSLIQRTQELSKTTQKAQIKTVELTNTIKIIEYKTVLWKIIAAGIFGFFVGLIPMMFKHILSKKRAQAV